jgi:hypothetical protein
MTRSRFNRTTRHVPVKHTSPNSDDAVAVLYDLDLAIADPVAQRPRADAQVSGGLDDGEQLVRAHTRCSFKNAWIVVVMSSSLL